MTLTVLSVLTYKRNIQPHSHDHLCRGKAITITYSECLLQTYVSSMQSARTISSSVACMALQYISILSDKRGDFSVKRISNKKKCVLVFSTTWSKTLTILRRINRDNAIKVHWSQRKVNLIIVGFLTKLESISADVRKIFKYQIS